MILKSEDWGRWLSEYGHMPDDVTLMSRAYTVEGETNSHGLSSEIHSHTVSCMPHLPPNECKNICFVLSTSFI